MQDLDLDTYQLSKVLEKFSNEERYDLVLPCIIKHILEPRFRYIAFLKILIKKLDKDINISKKSLKELEKEATTWILRPNNNFLKLATQTTQIKTPEYIPSEISRIFKKTIGLDASNIYSDYTNELGTDEISILTRELINEWENPNIGDKVITKGGNKLPDKVALIDTTYGQSFESRMPSWSNTKIENDSIQKRQDNIEKSHMSSVDPKKKEDSDRFPKIFKYIEEYSNVKLDPTTKQIISSFWYGSVYGESDRTNFIDFTSDRNIKIKIKDKTIDGETSRTILQVYITGIILELGTETIFNIISKLQSGKDRISPAKIFNNKTMSPSSGIVSVFKSVFPGMEGLDNSENMNTINLIIRNWGKLVRSSIDVENLLNFVHSEKSIDKNDKFTFKVKITRVMRTNPDISRKDFIKTVKDIIRQKTLVSFGVLTVNKLGELLG
jgi:hypothetical protein